MKPAPRAREATFMGIKRADGRVATRNYIGMLSSVNCSATAARAIADHFSRQTNPAGAGGLSRTSTASSRSRTAPAAAWTPKALGMQILERTLAGYATHANFAAVLVVGLGCEANQINAWLAHSSLREGETLQVFNIQDTGGTRKTVEKGIALVKEMLPRGQPREARALQRGAHHHRPAVRRLGRLFGHQRQPGARRGGRPAGGARRHRHPVAKRRRSTAPSTC